MTESDSRNTSPHLAYLNGQWLSPDALQISVNDLGFRQAATAVERLRTYGGRPFQVAAHLDRWEATVGTLNIAGLPNREQLGEFIGELLERNCNFVRSLGDVGITIFATPGELGSGVPSLGLHLNRLDHRRIQAWQRSGQPIVPTDVVQPSPASWPRNIKVRCRLHYYLADLEAKAEDPNAVGVLLDTDGTVTETSIANVAVVEGSMILSPPHSRVLDGITQGIVERLASAKGIEWRKERLEVERLTSADEVLLMGTDAGLWFANRVGKHRVSDGSAGPVYRTLLEDFRLFTERSCSGRGLDEAD